jgi:CheY-like chemotaxis protein/two-component sensor histidine kinase
MRQTIERQSSQLARIIDELLDVNRVARGQFTIEKETLDLREILHRAIETSRPLIEARQHKLDVDIAGVPIPVHADPLRMQQVVVNLLNNAAKYTPSQGTITLDASAVDGHAEIRVRDTGKGIPRDALDRVFDLFIQLEPNSGSALGGLGVGLALVRRIVELHGGRVQARSEGVGRGAEFNVRLPLSQSAITSRIADDALDPKFSAAVRVLVVDDNVDAADSLTMMLQAAGQEARAVYDGATALRLFETFRPHLILLDIGMPQMNGYDVARALRSAPAGHDPVIAAVSGWGQEADKARASAAGFDRHFTKPISESALRTLVAEAAEKRVNRIGGATGILRSLT